MEVRDKLKIIHPDLNVYKMGELIGSMWQGLSEAEKQVYRDDYQREKDQNLDRLGDENPNAQIPMFSAFLRFMKENRGPYCGWNEDITWNPQTCKMSLKWHLLPEQEKKRYLDAAQEDNNGCSNDIGESKETESYAAIKNQLKPPEETLSFDDFKKNPVPSDDIDDSGLSISLIEGTKSMPDLQVEPIVVALPKSGSMKASMADNNSKKRKVDLLRDVIIFKSPDSTEPPISAFLRFVKVNRASVLRKNPQMTLLDVQRRLSLMWHFLPEQEKQRYEEAGLEENGHCGMQENTQIELGQPLESQQTLKDLFQEIKPDSSFLRFSKEWLEQLQNGSLSNDEIIDIIEKEWAQLSHLQKRKYWYFEAKTRDKRYWDSKMKTLQIYKRKHNLGSKASKALIGQSVDSNQKSIVPAHSSFENYSSTNMSHMFSAEKSHLENIDGVASNRLIPVASTQCKDNFDDDFIITVKVEFDSDVENENNVMADHIEAVPMEQSPCAGSQSIEVVQPSSKCSELENGLKIIKRDTDVPKVIEGTAKQSFSDEICITGQNSKMELSVLGKTVEPQKCIASVIDNSAEVAHVPVEEAREDGSISIGDSIIIDENGYHITMNDDSDFTAEDDDIQITDVCLAIEDPSANNVYLK
ncbi:uncharacterized protein LOC127831778 [Dreissena polymorpha]|nr:uncharacterized protein LOC127831778 [Dreissena polymorpha]